MEKFAINSLISATHTAEMDEEDRKDIIKKINSAGNEDDNSDNEDDNSDNQDDTSDDFGSDDNGGDEFGGDLGSDEDNADEDLQELSVYEAKLNNLFINPKKNNMFQPGSNDILNENEETPTRYMFFSNLEQMRRQAGLLLDLDEAQIEAILNSGHDWAADHIAEAKNNMDQVFDFLMNETKSGDAWKSVEVDGDEDDYSEWSKPMEMTSNVPVSSDLEYHIQNEIALGESVFRYGSDKFMALLKEVKSLYSKGLITLNENDAFIVNDFDLGYLQVGNDKIKMNFIFEEVDDELLNEAEYQGKKVTLNKPFRTANGPKKFSVYVQNDKGNVVKVNFGDPNMEIKRDDPARRKSYRARHHCETPGPKWKANYWSCKMWSNPKVSDLT